MQSGEEGGGGGGGGGAGCLDPLAVRPRAPLLTLLPVGPSSFLEPSSCRGGGSPGGPPQRQRGRGGQRALA